MEDERIPDGERLQIEHIRELEDEELEVEEVDDEEDSSDYDDQPGSAYGEFTYDLSLAASHSYLGEVEGTHRGLAFLEGGVVITLPLFYLEGVVLFPEATLPLRVVVPNFVAAVERALGQVDTPCTIGVVRAYRGFNNGRIRFATTGTTAEVKQYRRLEDGSVNVVTRGQQRFRLRRSWTDVEGVPCGEIQIIQEDLPLRTPREAVGKLAPLRNLLTSMQPLKGPQLTPPSCEDVNDSDAMSEGSFESELLSTERRLHQSAVSGYGSDTIDESVNSDDDESSQDLECEPGRSRLDSDMKSMHTECSKRNEDSITTSGKIAFSDVQPCNRVGQEKYLVGQLRDVPRAFWPSWVFRMFDSYSLAQRAADRWKQVVKAPSMDGFVMKPDLLSFHIASKIPVSESTRQELLEIDGISYRLRREIELLESFDRIRCRICQTLVARRSDMLVMSSEGPLGAYANPHGFVHEVLTVFKTIGIAVAGPPRTEFSWFPGYSWSVTLCVTCGNSMGWLFTATQKKMRPRKFWGIRSSQILDDTC